MEKKDIILATIVLVIFGVGGIITAFFVNEGMNKLSFSHNETYEGIIIDIQNNQNSYNTDKIVFETGEVLFVGDVSKFEWTLGKEHIITVSVTKGGHKQITDVKQFREA